MTGRERVKIAMNGGVPDRVPVFPVITDRQTTYRYGVPLWQTAALPRLSPNSAAGRGQAAPTAPRSGLWCAYPV